MLPKVTGYTGFQSYGILPYPHLKPGKKTLDSKEVWEKTTRTSDHMKFYENYKRLNTNYNTQFIETVNPKDYAKDIKVRSPDFYFKAANDVPNENRDSKKIDPRSTSLNTKEKVLLQSGTEHWETTYSSNIVDPYSYSKSSKPLWSLHKPPYTVDSRVGPTEYGTILGGRGTKPTDKLDAKSIKQPRIEDPLKMGTSQVSDHIPGYTGFIPRAKTHSKAYEQGIGQRTRTTFLKQNIMENYHTRIPGYAGHQPMSAINQRIALRESCFSTK